MCADIYELVCMGLCILNGVVEVITYIIEFHVQICRGTIVNNF